MNRSPNPHPDNYYVAGPSNPVSRAEMTAMRLRAGMEPCTFNYADPTDEMHKDPLWIAIWDEIKTWDINVPTEYGGYSEATGNHVTAIYLAIQAKLHSALPWRCFNCDFCTSDPKEAAAHFGDRDDPEEFKPVCKWWASIPKEDRASLLQDVLKQVDEARL